MYVCVCLTSIENLSEWCVCVCVDILMYVCMCLCVIVGGMVLH